MTRQEKKDFEKWVRIGKELLDQQLELECSGKEDAVLNEQISDLLRKLIYSIDRILIRTS